ncbi:MAG: alanine racemase [Xanthomonadaceae bacterium]|nr:alanine racemase [Xanthomonadaceae bacterium]
MSRNTFATIDTPALSRNLERVRTIVGGARIMAVIKADAYGHGLGQCVPALAKADLLAVATLDEASAVRAIDARAAILLLEGITSRGELDEVRRLDLELVFHHSAQLDWGRRDHRLRCAVSRRPRHAHRRRRNRLRRRLSA